MINIHTDWMEYFTDELFSEEYAYIEGNQY